VSETHQQHPPYSSDSTGERVNRKIEEAARTLELETEKFIQYINNEVVPEVRKHSSRGLRTASEKLREFADYLDKNNR
jgi:hypothetical protein